MISIYDEATLRAARQRRLDNRLRSVLDLHLDHTAESRLLNMTHLLLVEQADTDESIEKELGFSPLVCPIDGHHWRDTRFVPHWSWLYHRPGSYELIITVGDSGFAYILLVTDNAEAVSDLVLMCRHHYGASNKSAD